MRKPAIYTFGKRLHSPELRFLTCNMRRVKSSYCLGLLWKLNARNSKELSPVSSYGQQGGILVTIITKL